jgi:hypothetical protein
MSTQPQVTEQQMLAQDLAAFTHDPLGAVMYGFPGEKVSSRA